MRTAIDRAGRVVIPKEVRREAGLRPGTRLEVRWRAGRIEIEPATLPVRLVRRGRWLVAQPRRSAGALGAQSVEQARKAMRRERLPRR